MRTVALVGKIGPKFAESQRSGIGNVYKINDGTVTYLDSRQGAVTYSACIFEESGLTWPGDWDMGPLLSR